MLLQRQAGREKLDAYAADSYVEGIASLGSGFADPNMVGSAAQMARSSTRLFQQAKESTSPDLSSGEGQESASSLPRPRGRKCKNSPLIYAFGWGGALPGRDIMPAWEQGNAHLRGTLPGGVQNRGVSAMLSELQQELHMAIRRTLAGEPNGSPGTIFIHRSRNRTRWGLEGVSFDPGDRKELVR